MPRFSMSLSVLAIVAALVGGSAFAQTATGDKAKTDQTAQQKMKTSEDPSSPAMQQAAAKQADCKKQAKAKKLTRSARSAFMKDCMK